MLSTHIHGLNKEGNVIIFYLDVLGLRNLGQKANLSFFYHIKVDTGQPYLHHSVAVAPPGTSHSAPYFMTLNLSLPGAGRLLPFSQPVITAQLFIFFIQLVNT